MTPRIHRFAWLAVTLGAVTAHAQAHAQARDTAIVQRWDATIAYDSLTIPFPLELRQRGSSIQAVLFNGDQPVLSTSGRRVGDSVFIAFDHLATVLKGRISNDRLTAEYGGANGRAARPIVASPRVASAVAERGPAAPDIAGTWLLPANSAKGERAWRFVVRQTGNSVTATVLRVDGDAGAHTGVWRDGRFLLSHFDGGRPSQIEVVPRATGLEVTLISTRGRGQPVIALRPETAIAQSLPLPADFSQHTRVKNPDEPFRFSFPDLSGKVVANTDAAFANKVVIVAIGGTWCPNCHDEAPFLSQLYARYRDRGLEIVALDFEDAEQLKTLTRPRAFVAKYGIEYSFLIAGATSELQAKLPQAENLDSWPTTFFLGRDGRVKAVHAGFAAAASGSFHDQLVAEYTGIIERLLAEPATATSSNKEGSP